VGNKCDVISSHHLFSIQFLSPKTPLFTILLIIAAITVAMPMPNCAMLAAIRIFFTFLATKG
jgi:hypothetical protein